MVNLQEIYKGLQKEMLDDLERGSLVTHPTAKGDDSEEKWRNWLRKYLPKKYSVDKAFIIDHEGHVSEQIDCVVYDNFHSPPIIEQDGYKYVPAESVYAIFEIKQEMTKEHINYAMSKASSVRSLKRTRSPFKHASGVSNTEPAHIIAGILTKKCEISERAVSNHLNCEDLKKRLDMVCSLNRGAFYDEDKKLIFFNESYSLVSFLYEFLSVVRKNGTVAAIDYSQYLELVNRDV